MQQYPKNNIEGYGLSMVELVELNPSDDSLTTLNVDGCNVLLPVLNLKKYNSNCHCYALIERLKEYRITMVDLLYTYQEMDFDNDFLREEFLHKYDRKKINYLTTRSPGIIVQPKNNENARDFLNAINSALEDSVGNKICLFNMKQENKYKVEEEVEEKKRESSALMDCIKIWYLCLGGTIESKKSTVTKNMEHLLTKSAIFLKNGEAIINGTQASKYLTLYKTQSILNENEESLSNDELKNLMSVYITGVNDYSLINSKDYLKKFGEIILSSYILEALFAVNVEGIPNFAYAGQFDIRDERLKVNLDVEKYFNKMNELLFLSRDEDGR